MNVDAYRELQLLTEISTSASVTQRHLAKKHGLALGLTNFLIHRLIKKGHVKIVNLERKRLRYLITPKGIAEKARLTYEYVEYSLHLYRQIRTLVTRTISTMAASEGTAVVLYGTGEIAEIAFLLIQQRGLSVVGVVDESRSDQSLFMSHAVTPPEALARLSFDWVLIASFKNHEQIIQQLCRWGVPEQKIVRISEEQQAPSLPETMVEVSSS